MANGALVAIEGPAIERIEPRVGSNEKRGRAYATSFVALEVS